ncbi:uncharacterized protein PHALS_08883 [Plasmopara halstedii]|uniref:Uncharacterized protein n=1 Tax=Plasmopara halstedii TaxID=4781 RepID=A0A0P1ADY5_PLAHL|nr:uncharacterized protein PHALS_08883 [Plasmopara halstedii]CEG38832.1 hypothetical protein PHALS_08883 [Plasmopara halstedii]|eukprot:XP_024575201.1 hypothetical protein PHALS_08883 [Plasmopara halstedii]
MLVIYWPEGGDIIPCYWAFALVGQRDLLGFTHHHSKQTSLQTPFDDPTCLTLQVRGVLSKKKYYFHTSVDEGFGFEPLRRLKLNNSYVQP